MDVRIQKNTRLGHVLTAGILIAVFAAAAVASLSWSPWGRLGVMTLGLLYLLKLLGVLTGPPLPLSGLAVYLAAWPGVEPDAFRAKTSDAVETGQGFASGWWRFLIGFSACVALSIFARQLDSDWLGWLGLGSLILMVHLGVGQMLPIILRACGWPVGELFHRPWASHSLTDFWSARWNLAFIGMNRSFVLPTVRRWFGRKHAILAAFLVSGLFHELAISYPAGAGWGLPFAYFAIQALGLWIEHRLKLRSRVFLWSFFLAWLPLLFHQPFMKSCIEPLFLVAGDAIRSVPELEWFSFGIWVLGGLQLLVLAASFQVPKQLEWRKELAPLSSLNRKFVWTSGGFTVLTILFFAAAVFLLHGSFLAGDREAGVIALFACIYWSTRLLIDFTWMTQEDWPGGAYFAIGHALLTTLFATLAAGYGTLAIWCLILTRFVA